MLKELHCKPDELGLEGLISLANPWRYLHPRYSFDPVEFPCCSCLAHVRFSAFSPF